MSTLKLVESSYEELLVFTPQLFYVIDPKQGFIEPVKIVEGGIYVWDSNHENWEHLTILNDSEWIKGVKIFLLEEHEDE